MSGHSQPHPVLAGRIVRQDARFHSLQGSQNAQDIFCSRKRFLASLGGVAVARTTSFRVKWKTRSGPRIASIGLRISCRHGRSFAELRARGTSTATKAARRVTTLTSKIGFGRRGCSSLSTSPVLHAIARPTELLRQAEREAIARKELQDGGETRQLVKTVETLLGKILRWRLLLFHVSMNTIGQHQTTWIQQEQVLTFEDSELRIDQAPTLLASEYCDCQRLLYDDVTLDLKNFRRMHAWALKGTLDVDVLGWSFLQHRDNALVLKHGGHTLLSIIELSHDLSRLSLTRVPQASSGFT
ncbi:hypothetical protein LTR91_025953 [Friedmanniomyces endolithicus]|uniref:Uncharacterized protein n=2 Tax=Dothideomycetidae TaxID=451867 RepID=A0AAN6JW35_9PEZI|nr:hypothetical protein LTR94_022145 [Friedmanniomyces endolithicus]KAK0825820.1 hypothetical protein LTR03_017327 [Friedmanniomyces endolithicus]KAK0856001.1 hypothetical protein LTS02_010802 [Friedmanniomyces endolithicus]KAK0889461.1 hypothetical protein LTR57_025370 [Friedmanniomyces endolithicus]KAK0950064.1 hypothetical protein LTR91_025953 [Friedmanniomyces endolithicus]